ncbi:unnamed protein product [Darwinula stevensoni]|uniref:RZ-type domain-containing protein n=1 Tax=Darwinula stevensoni TaxID=69355 RepID=A0A7R9AKD1_9CRUS|nr:unnamed protein product [Darwinula stevensoni]CAG0909952.1 unnamed protein product [Darwinula stevensoni]
MKRILCCLKKETANHEATEHIRKAEAPLLSLETFTDAMNEAVRRELDAASRICGESGISNHERIMILQAMHLGQGLWYKCPNGHIYANGERIEAMQESKCNECGDKRSAPAAHAWVTDDSRHE